MRPNLRAALVLGIVASFAAFSSTVGAQTARDQNVAKYEKRRKEELMAAGQRHVDLGWSIRKSGLQQQATYQFIRAVELSEGTHQGASWVLNTVRAYGDAFWRKARKKPTRASLLRYRKRAAGIEEDDQKGQARLAKLAEKARLAEPARAHWLAALRLGAELELIGDETKGRVAKVGGQKVGTEHIDWLQAQTIVVGDRRQFDVGSFGGGGKPAAAKAPELPGLVEARSDQLVVRTDLGDEVAAELCALGTELCEPLRERLDGLPVKALRLIVFKERTDYDAYLTARGHAAATAGRGLCDYGAYQTMVCAEGLDPASLQAIVLHELTHLFFWGASPVAMPDWYAEGLAESFGGQGTFTWDGKKLITGGPMQRERIDAVRNAPMPLLELFAVDILALLARDHDQGMRYYAQCQLFQRFVRQPGCKWRERFEWWEDECRGSLAGTSSTARFGDVAPASQSFQKLFGEDLDALGVAFREWLAQQ